MEVVGEHQRSEEPITRTHLDPPARSWKSGLTCSGTAEGRRWPPTSRSRWVCYAPGVLWALLLNREMWRVHPGFGGYADLDGDRQTSLLTKKEMQGVYIWLCGCRRLARGCSSPGKKAIDMGICDTVDIINDNRGCMLGRFTRLTGEPNRKTSVYKYKE